MKKLILSLGVFLCSISLNAQDLKEKAIDSKVIAATVFMNSAQVYREKTVILNKGEQTLRFKNLSPFIDKKSIQVQLADTEIRAINFEKNNLENTKKNKTQLDLENKLLDIVTKINIENVNLTSTLEEIQFLKNNSSIKGNQTLTVNALRESLKFYSSEMKNLKLKELNIKNTLLKLNEDKNQIDRQLKDLNLKNRFASGEIVIKLKSESEKKSTLKLNYNVSNVSWYPSYDIRVKNINSPLQIVYKANLKQNSQVNWDNVKLSFSSANPSNSNKAGQIIPYFLDYGTRPPYYGKTIDEVSGYVRDNNGPLPGVNINVKGTTIGTSTNFDGKYEIKIPKDAKELEFSYLGFKSTSRSINNNIINVTLQEDSSILDEVVVVGYGTRKNENIVKTLRGKASGMAVSSINALDDSSKGIETKQNVNQTSFNIEVVEPYTVNSSNKDFIISMETYQTNANYTYYSVPKIEKSAFLLATIQNWEKYNLLEGEANVYFENTFIGSTLIDTRTSEKDLNISLGKDKNVVVDRLKSKNFTSKQFIGNKKEETIHWDILIKNNKSEKIKMIVLDQIPISQREEITVSLDKNFDGDLNSKSGEIKWSFNLEPKKSKKLQLKYDVKYPKNRNLIID